MQNTLAFHFTDKNIAPAIRTTASEELLSLLALSTRTLWQMTSAGTAREIMTPFRQVRFWSEVNGAWQTYRATGALPLVVRAEIEPTPENEIRDNLWDTLDLPQDGIAGQAYRFFEARVL